MGTYHATTLSFSICFLRFFVNFPDWLPLQEWVPAVFEATGDCAVRQWAFLGLDMPQWLIGIFAAYLLVAIIVIISQFFQPKIIFKTPNVKFNIWGS